MGGEGVMVATSQGTTIVPPYFVKVVSGLGAGDAFGGMLVHGLLVGLGPGTDRRVLQRCRRDRGVTLLCSDAMPTLAEVEDALEDRRVAG